VIYESMTIVEFQERFRTEKDCLDYLVEMRWPRGFICPKCGHNDGHRLKTRRAMQCTVCRAQASITAGTIFHKTRIQLQYWFWMIYLVAEDKGGASASRIEKQLQMHHDTVWHILHKIRMAMANRDERYTLAGFIELDEGFFGRAETAKKPEKADNQAEVIVMIEVNESGNPEHLSMKVVDTTSRDSIRAFVEPKVEPNQAFKTDGAQSHYVLKSMGHKLQAKVIPAWLGHIELPWVHKAISLAKRFILGTYHGVSSAHLQRYLDEFCYRFNRRHRSGEIAARLLNACLMCLPRTYAAVS